MPSPVASEALPELVTEVVAEETAVPEGYQRTAWYVEDSILCLIRCPTAVTNHAFCMLRQFLTANKMRSLA